VCNRVNGGDRGGGEGQGRERATGEVCGADGLPRHKFCKVPFILTL
jgi:hypothetical protein